MGSAVTKLRAMIVVDILNTRLLWDDGEEFQLREGDRENLVYEWLLSVWKYVTSRVKINCSYGVILENEDTNQLRYFRTSSDNAEEFEELVSIKSEKMLVLFFAETISRRPEGRSNNTQCLWVYAV